MMTVERGEWMATQSNATTGGCMTIVTAGRRSRRSRRVSCHCLRYLTGSAPSEWTKNGSPLNPLAISLERRWERYQLTWSLLLDDESSTSVENSGVGMEERRHLGFPAEFLGESVSTVLAHGRSKLRIDQN